MKYVVKHININNLRHTNIFLKYFSDIDFKHYVFNIDDATHFKTRKRAKEMIRKFKHPDLWEIVGIKDDEKRR